VLGLVLTTWGLGGSDLHVLVDLVVVVNIDGDGNVAGQRRRAYGCGTLDTVNMLAFSD